jgi:hypothetical protein
MSIISILLGMSMVGVVLWIINTYVPLNGKIKKTFNIVVVIIVTLWLLSAFGVFGAPSDIYIGDLHM